MIVNDHAPNLETVGDAGLTFSGREGVPALTEQLERILAEPELVDDYRGRARERARRYSWDAVTDEYEALLRARARCADPACCRPSCATRRGARPEPSAVAS